MSNAQKRRSRRQTRKDQTFRDSVTAEPLVGQSFRLTIADEAPSSLVDERVLAKWGDIVRADMATHLAWSEQNRKDLDEILGVTR